MTEDGDGDVCLCLTDPRCLTEEGKMKGKKQNKRNITFTRREVPELWKTGGKTNTGNEKRKQLI